MQLGARPRIAFVAGLNTAIIVSWFHGKKGRQRVPTTEKLLLSFVLAGWIAVTVALLL